MKIKRTIASVMAALTVAVPVNCLSASAYNNTYTDIQPYKSGSNVYFGNTVTNHMGRVVILKFAGQLYDNYNNSFINSISDTENDVANNMTVTLRSSYAYSSLPNNVKCINNVRTYYWYDPYASPFETYSNNTYYNK